jgi:molybdopterin adenylyltransferase
VSGDDPVRVGVLTISDGCAAGVREDRSGAAIVDWCREREHQPCRHEVVPDDQGTIAGTLIGWADSGSFDVIITTGGTGFGPRDVTPEAMGSVLERESPGIAEAIRARGTERLPAAMLSRGRAGIRAQTLVVNLPGSPGGVRDGLAVLGSVVEHAVALLRNASAPHPSPETE